MSRKFLLLLVPAVLGFTLSAQAARDLIPAGTLLHCTMDEVNFSPKTAQVGDPVLCNLGPLGTFGHSVFPRGAELSGHLQDYKAPGHFWGKGWMAIEFDRMILPGAQVLPLSAKIVGAPHNKVDAHGDIKGKGHPTRDALLWTVPIFWPIKVLTLPARGPYPTLKGENRLTLRLMEDVEVPFAVAHNGVPMPDYRPSAYRGNSSHNQAAVDYRADLAVPSSQPIVRSATYMQQPRASVYDSQVTVIALQAGAAVLATRYWIEGSDLHCVKQDGSQKTLALSMVDLSQTVKLNQERNVDFSLRTVRPQATLLPNTIEQ
ncbi:MAG TPA: hypothetical protein VFA85_05945 [Terriglobales bacterium]|nr:hypothetical protein [Terriglobales bacterium]